MNIAKHWMLAAAGVTKGAELARLAGNRYGQGVIVAYLETMGELMDFNTQSYRYDRGGEYINDAEYKALTKRVWKRG